MTNSFNYYRVSGIEHWATSDNKLIIKKATSAIFCALDADHAELLAERAGLINPVCLFQECLYKEKRISS